jgi:hypothetical protein
MVVQNFRVKTVVEVEISPSKQILTSSSGRPGRLQSLFSFAKVIQSWNNKNQILAKVAFYFF